jgi:putative peptidoglycan lipid II flippase
MDTSHSILRSAKYFFAGTALSRLSGLFRDMAMAFCFGGAPEVAAFMVAYRLANLLRRLFGEGNLQSGFVPHFETVRAASPQAAFSFYRDSAYSLFALLALCVLAIEGILWLLLGVLPAGWREIAELTMWMAPGLLFICLSALNGALLQCQKKYFIPAIAPVLFNAVWIAAAVLSARFSLPEAVRFLSIGVMLAFAAQWGATAAKVRKEVNVHLDWKEWLQPRLFSSEWKKLLRPLALGVIGIGAMQINSALDSIFARIADLSGPTFLWYAIRVQQLPLALFGIALSGALLPPLSRAMLEGDLDRYRGLLSGSLRQAAALMVPCAFGLFALGAAGLNLLYGRGHFSSADLQETLFCLWAYGLGLVPASFVLLLAVGSYAKKSYGSATHASLISVAVNVAFNAILVFGFHWGAVSIALATSVSAWLNCALLARNQSLELGFWGYLAKVTAAAAAASALSLGCGQWLLGDGTLALCIGDSFAFSRSPVQQIIQFVGMGSIFLASFLGIAWRFRLHEIFMLLQMRQRV